MWLHLLEDVQVGEAFGHIDLQFIKEPMDISLVRLRMEASEHLTLLSQCFAVQDYSVCLQGVYCVNHTSNHEQQSRGCSPTRKFCIM